MKLNFTAGRTADGKLVVLYVGEDAEAAMQAFRNPPEEIHEVAVWIRPEESKAKLSDSGHQAREAVRAEKSAAARAEYDAAQEKRAAELAASETAKRSNPAPEVQCNPAKAKPAKVAAVTGTVDQGGPKTQTTEREDVRPVEAKQPESKPEVQCNPELAEDGIAAEPENQRKGAKGKGAKNK